MKFLHKKFAPRELWALFTIAGSAFCVLGGYEFLRSPSTVLYKKAYGADNLTVVMALIPVAVICVLYIYARLLSWMGPKKTLLVTTLGSALVIFGCYSAIKQGSQVATAILYLYREAYIVLIIEQYWSFINSTFSSETAKRLNGPIAGLSGLGAILGGFLVYKLAEPLGTSSMLLFSIFSLVPAAIISQVGYLKCGEPLPSRQEAGGKAGHLGLHEFRTSPLLIFILCIVMASQVISATTSLSFQTIVETAFPSMDQQTAFQGQFFGWVNLIAALLQFFIAPLILSFTPVGWVLMVIALIHIATCGALLFYPSLATASTAYLLFKSFDYSLFRVTKETLYIPLSFDARYRAKELIDIFGYRFSKGGCSLIIALIQKAGFMFTNLYSSVALGAAAVWLGLLVPLMRHLPRRERINS